MDEQKLTNTPEISVLDGHDGSGNTTLARLVAESLEGTYVKPFDGTLGDMLAWLCEEQRFDLADQLARASIQKIMNDHSGSPTLIFDRHWMSMFTLFPVELRSSWFPLPATVLCWAYLETTISRLSSRGEDPGDEDGHRHFVQSYLRLAEKHSVPVADTTRESIRKSLPRILNFLPET